MPGTPRRLAAIITGASRGFGRAIALSLVNRTIALSTATGHSGNENSDSGRQLAGFASVDVVLASRDIDGTNETANLVRTAASEIQRGLGSQVESAVLNVATVHLDLASPPAHLDASLNLLFSPSGTATGTPTGTGTTTSAFPRPLSHYTSAILFHNAGTLGPLARVRDLVPHTASLSLAIAQDLAAYIALTARFLDAFKDTGDVVLVNVSSLAAVEPCDAWAVYGAGKAGREMVMKTVAVEEGPRVRTLNYAPGPLSTTMQSTIRTSMPDVPARRVYVAMHERGELVDPH
ncbi:hypothetical protein HDU93_002269, partial [Gonapodya sp. JEL0774]